MTKLATILLLKPSFYRIEEEKYFENDFGLNLLIFMFYIYSPDVFPLHIRSRSYARRKHMHT